MWTWRDATLALLILALAVGWFSTHGPVELPEERGLGPGTELAGESPLVVSGSGAEIVTITQADAVTEPVAASAEQESPERETTPENEEEPIMQDFSGLVWMATGAVVFLAGLLSGPLVAGLWGRIRDHKT